MKEKEAILKKIQDTILSGDLLNGKKLIEQYEENIEINDETKNMKAIISFYDGNYDEALKNIREGLKYNIYNSDLYYCMGNVYESLCDIIGLTFVMSSQDLCVLII